MSRCLLVSSRLPVAYNENSQEFTPSSGGLVSAIKGLDVKKVGHVFEWMGIVTDDLPLEKINQLREVPYGDLQCHPIVIPKEVYHQYYNCFSNNVVWPLFHYERSMVQHTDIGWKNYVEVNERVAEAILNEAKDDDTIWVHDFHLFLVPGILKQKRADLRVGFFLHIPFPSSEIFRELPQRKDVLLSLMQCDLVGFHDFSYLTHFKSSLSRVLGENNPLLNDGKLGVYPISIDTQNFIELMDAPETQDFIKLYGKTKKEMKWILGVDRLDYIKGLVLKFQAFEEFLTRNPDQVGKVQMVQVVIPSREEVPQYQELKQSVEQLVSSINGKFGTPNYMPIQYLYHSVSSFELSALYQLCEVMHIGSRRDGMNLVSLEYVASQSQSHPGTLLLSEFTGAHSTLSYALSINPWNIVETANKIKEALNQPLEKRDREMTSMKNFLRSYTSSEWAGSFMRDLLRQVDSSKNIQALDSKGKFPWMKDLKGKRVLFFCDLDGTLAPISSLPSKVSLGPETQNLLKNISHKKNLEFVVVSGRDRDFLHTQFVEKNDFHFPLAACHGAYCYSPETHEWGSLIPHDGTKWKDSLLEVLKLYTLRTPGSFIEDKGHAIAWHYRNSPSQFADFQANKLFIELEESLTSLPAQVTRGKKVIEVKSLHASKGFFVQHWIEKHEYLPDVVIALGDDTTDEDMFEYLQNKSGIESYSIKVGEEKTNANYYLSDQTSVNSFLQTFTQSM